MSMTRGRSPTDRELGGVPQVLPPMHSSSFRVAAPGAGSKAPQWQEVQALWDSIQVVHQDMVALRQEVATLAAYSAAAAANAAAGAEAGVGSYEGAAAALPVSLEVGSLAEDLQRLRDDLDALSMEVQDRGQVECATGALLDVRCIMEAIRQERHERLTQMAEHEASLRETTASVARVDSEVVHHEEWLSSMWQEREHQRQEAEAAQQLPVLEVVPAWQAQGGGGDLGGMLEILQQRLRDEVAGITERNQRQNEELKALITKAFSQPRAPASDGAGSPSAGGASRREVEELVAQNVQDSIQQALGRQSTFTSIVKECVEQVLASDSVLDALIKDSVQEALAHQPCWTQQAQPKFQLSVDGDTPKMCARAAVSPATLHAHTVTVLSSQGSFSFPQSVADQNVDLHQMMKVQACQHESAATSNDLAKGMPVAVADAGCGGAASLAHTTMPPASGATSSPAPGAAATVPMVGTPGGGAEGWRSPLTPPSQRGSQVPAECFATYASELTSPPSGVRAVLPQAFQVVSNGMASGAVTPRPGSSSRNSSRSWTATATSLASAGGPPPRVAAPTPTTPGGASASGSASGLAGSIGAPVAARPAGTAVQQTSYAQRRRLATSRGAAIPATPSLPVATPSLYSTRTGSGAAGAATSAGVMVRQCLSGSKCRPESHEQQQRCFRVRAAR